MDIIPAIDLKDGKVVRLTRGDYKNITVYSEDPSDIARKWSSQGARILHVVDLDGALCGEPKNMDSVESIVKSVDISVQLGGGLRNFKDIDKAFDVGIARIVLGTKALEDPAFIASAIKKYGKRIVVSIDTKGGAVMTQGWTRPSDVSAIDMADRVARLGVSTVIHTDVVRNGTLKGPDFSRLEDFLSRVSLSVIVAGGVATIEDIRKFRALNKKNLKGVIAGKALYEGTLDLKEAIKICS